MKIVTFTAGLCFFLACVGRGELNAADSVDLAARGAEAHTQAEAALVASRTRIAAEHAHQLAHLQQAVHAAQMARERLTTVERDAATATAAITAQLKDHERALAQVKQLADRAVVAAKVDAITARALVGAPPHERAQAALAAADARVAALPGRLAARTTDEAVIGRSGKIATVPVLRLGEARAIALGSEHDLRGILERASDGQSWLVTGPTLPATVTAAPGALIALDAHGDAAHQAPHSQRTFTQWIAAGRAFIWPILAIFVLGLAIALHRAIDLQRREVEPLRLVAVATCLAERGVAAAAALVQAGANPLDRVLRAGLAKVSDSREVRESAVEQALLKEMAALNTGLPFIAVLAGVAPLLGLLGTVTGMIDMFSVIASQGTGNASSLSGGISEALICTQAGMLVAIPLLILHAWLGRLADRRSQVLEEAACGILGLSEHNAP